MSKRRVVQQPTLPDLSQEGTYYGQSFPNRPEDNDSLDELGNGLLPPPVGGGSISGTGTFGRENNLRKLLPNGSSYRDILMTGQGYDDFLNYLGSLGIDYDKSMSATQKADWNKQLADSILNYLFKVDERNYNRSMQEDQRKYDNPLNQLMRLMGTGMSRDAALQLLSGGSSSSGGAVPYSQGLAPATGIAASQSSLNDIQAKTAIANTVFGGFSVLSNLVGLGFTVPQAIQQTRFLENQNTLTGRQLSAYDSAGRAYQILNAAGAAADVFGSVASASSALTNLANSGNTDAAQFIASGGLNLMNENAPFASQTLSQLYRSERSSSDYAQQFTAELSNTYADIDLKKANKDNLHAQINKYNAEIQQIHASEDYTVGLTKLLEYQQTLLGSQSAYYDAETRAQQLANRLESDFQSSIYKDEDGKELNGVQWNSARRMNQLYIDVHGLIAQKDSKLWDKQINTMLKNEENLQALYDLSILYNKGTFDYVSNDMSESSQDMLYFCNACEDSGVFDYIRTLAGAETAGNVKISEFSSSTPALVRLTESDFLSNKGKAKKPWWKR